MGFPANSNDNRGPVEQVERILRESQTLVRGVAITSPDGRTKRPFGLGARVRASRVPSRATAGASAARAGVARARARGFGVRARRARDRHARARRFARGSLAPKTPLRPRDVLGGIRRRFSSSNALGSRAPDPVGGGGSGGAGSLPRPRRAIGEPRVARSASRAEATRGASPEAAAAPEAPKKHRPVSNDQRGFCTPATGKRPGYTNLRRSGQARPGRDAERAKKILTTGRVAHAGVPANARGRPAFERAK